MGSTVQFRSSNGTHGINMRVKADLEPLYDAIAEAQFSSLGSHDSSRVCISISLHILIRDSGRAHGDPLTGTHPNEAKRSAEREIEAVREKREHLSNVTELATLPTPGQRRLALPKTTNSSS